MLKSKHLYLSSTVCCIVTQNICEDCPVISSSILDSFQLTSCSISVPREACTSKMKIQNFLRYAITRTLKSAYVTPNVQQRIFHEILFPHFFSEQKNQCKQLTSSSIEPVVETEVIFCVQWLNCVAVTKMN